MQAMETHIFAQTPMDVWTLGRPDARMSGRPCVLRSGRSPPTFSIFVAATAEVTPKPRRYAQRGPDGPRRGGSKNYKIRTKKERL